MGYGRRVIFCRVAVVRLTFRILGLRGRAGPLGPYRLSGISISTAIFPARTARMNSA